MTIAQYKKEIAKLNLFLYPLGIINEDVDCNLPLPPFVNKLLREANEIRNPNNDDTPSRFGPKSNPRKHKDNN